jgi:monofunctional biosynthetic peptidoglycan transglycosylase
MRFPQRLFRAFVLMCLAALCLFLGFVALWRIVPPVSTLMLAHYVAGRPVERDWKPLDRISPLLVAAVVMSEDGQFCRHGGVDWKALGTVLDEADEDGPSRGASTITMQLVKNLFLWPGRSAIRKGLEIPMALGLDAAWPKRRVLEVYLNIAEWGDGIFGAEAAARRDFGKSAADLTLREAALLAASLPNPVRRDPRHPSRTLSRLAGSVMARVRQSAPWTDCLDERISR